MDFFKQLLPGGGQQQQTGETGLLADWQAYSGDVESGGAASSGSASHASGPKAAGSQIAKAAEDVGSSITGLLRTGYSAVSDGLGNIQAPSMENTLPSGQQLVYFASFLGGGVLFLFMAFFIGLPTLLLSPSKFALFFTLGCCFVMSGFAALKGWRSQMAHMLQRERLPFSAGYIGSIVLTLYAALIMHSYLLSLLCSVLQVVALLYYLTSYYPGGTSSVKFMLSMFGSAAGSCFSSCTGMILGK